MSDSAKASDASLPDGPDGPTIEGPPIDVEATLIGRNLIVIGCTGFVGKVWLSMVLDRYPGIGKLYTIVRGKKSLTPEERFWSEVVPSPVFDPLREKYPGKAYEDFMREHVVPVGGDVSNPLLGLGEAFVDEHGESIDAIVNVAGVVDFNPPLDDALKVNAFGARNLVDLAKRMGNKAIMHTSTCYVVGCRDGLVEERNTLEFPFPRADELDRSHWDAENEIAECIDVVEATRRRVEDAPRQSHLLDEAKKNLRDRQEPLRGSALDDELEQVKRRYVRKRLIEAGKERALFWGWNNIYTYTKSIGEQVLLGSGLPVAIGRPSIVESAYEFPFPGWCEGVSTSSPIMYLAYQGQQMIPAGKKCYYDAIPVDFVAAGMIATLAALLQRRHDDVYQYCTTDVNPLSMHRIVELTGLGKRRYYESRGKGNQLLNLLQAHSQPHHVDVATWRRWSNPANARRAKALSGLLKLAKDTPVGGIVRPATKQLDGFARISENIANVFEEFIPFMTANEFRFSARNTRKLHRSLTPADQERLNWGPHQIDWRTYWIDIHHQGVEKWSIPVLEDRLRKELKPLRRHDTIADMVEDICERHDHAPAFHRLEGDDLVRISYRDVEARSGAVAARLWEMGVRPGDRVALGGRNHPDWAIAYFGIVRTGAAAVPIDKDYESGVLDNVLQAAKVRFAIFDEHIAALPEHSPVAEKLQIIDIHTITEPAPALKAPDVEISGDAVASILYTSGTTGEPKGVVLTHQNFTALIAALAPLFPIGRRDRLLSVLPLHHTFEFTCGMLLPFSRGARVIYLDEINGERLVAGLERGQVTSMVGVPALWELLERRIMSEIRERGAVTERLFDVMLEMNRNMGRTLGFDMGKVLFAPVHHKLGGNLRLLISGAAALPPDVQKTFSGLGLHLSEGYGLTEAAPVLTVAKGKPSHKGGNVGRAIPGVEVKIDAPNAEGVGEVLARGPSVMQGYADNPEATKETLVDGWLRTGDLGKLDHKDRLTIVGRSKEVILSTSGENVYPDDVESLIGLPEGVKELSVVGLPDGKGAERVACLAVPDSEQSGTRQERHLRAKNALDRAFEKLPRVMRPSVVHLTEVDLPRTATRKVKRKEVLKFVERLQEAADRVKQSRKEGAGGDKLIRELVGAIARRKPEDITAHHDLAADLGFDSLMVVELVSAIEDAIPRVSAERVSECKTVGDIENLVRESKKDAKHVAAHKARSADIEKDEESEIKIPDLLIEPAKAVLYRGQMALYGQAFNVKIKGSANIPQNRHTLVVANHSSHLDMGLAKYALGQYGDGIVALAAEDYFFKDKYRRAFFENFTNMAAFDRKSGLRKAMLQAGEQLQAGRTVLIFPEGTRSADGIIRDFMPLIGHLALNYEVDILPLYLDGAHDALPRGSVLPRSRKLKVKIGPPLRVQELEQATQGKKRSDAYREVAKLAQRAVEALRDGTQLDLRHELRELERAHQNEAADPATPDSSPAAAETKTKTKAKTKTKKSLGEVLTSRSGGPSKVQALFEELEGRFVVGSVNKPTSFYFSLGDHKYTLEFDADTCSFRQGKPSGGKADCVLKTSPEMFTKIVRESYTPSVSEFMSGKVKSNDIKLLQVFQRAFDL